MLNCRTKPTDDEELILMNIEWVTLVSDPDTNIAAETKYLEEASRIALKKVEITDLKENPKIEKTEHMEEVSRIILKTVAAPKLMATKTEEMEEALRI